MQSAEKFMFDYSFDNEPEVQLESEAAPEQPEEAAEEEPIVPTFSEEDIEIARQQSFDAGKQEGLAATTETLAKQMNVTLALIDQKLTEAFGAQDAANEELARSALSVAKGICGKMLPTMAEKNAFDEVERVITEVFSKLVDHPSATISVHTSLLEAIEQRVKELSESKGYQGKIIFRADDTMAPDDCKVEWYNGGSERDSQAIWQEISTIIDRNINGTPTPWNEPDEMEQNVASTEVIAEDASETQNAPEEDASNALQQPKIDD